MFLDRFAVVPHGDQLADRHVSSVSQKARVHHARCLRRKQESFGRNDVNADFRLGRVFADFNGRQARLLANLAFHDVKTTIKQGSEQRVIRLKRLNLLGAVVFVVNLEDARFEQKPISNKVRQDGKSVILARKDMIDQGSCSVGLCYIISVARDKANDLLTAIKHVHQRRQ